MRTASEMLSLFNEALSNYTFDRKPSSLYEPVKYALSLGGKRIRPILMLMAYELYEKDASEILPTALGIEIYHNYTLLHDDVMDHADVRRGKPTVHKVWNENTAILSGDSMLVLAYQMMSQAKPLYIETIIKLFTETALEIGEGQQYDLEFENRNDVTETEYIEMIRLKTSVLLACALKTGAIQAGASQADADSLYAFGENLGLAFQLQDDLLDVYGNFATFGKKIGGDILCNKKTFLLIHALNGANEAQHKSLTFWLNKKDAQPEAKITAVTELYNSIGVRNLTQQRINSYFERACQALDNVAVSSQHKTNLRNYALSMLNRQS